MTNSKLFFNLLEHRAGDLARNKLDATGACKISESLFLRPPYPATFNEVGCRYSLMQLGVSVSSIEFAVCRVNLRRLNIEMPSAKNRAEFPIAAGRPFLYCRVSKVSI